MNVKLIDTAKVIRSKNSGPYELTLDIIFKDMKSFEAASAGGAFTKAAIAVLYAVNEDDVLDIVTFPPAKAIKATLKRNVVSGGPGDRDVYGAQQHAPLLELEYEIEGDVL